MDYCQKVLVLFWVICLQYWYCSGECGNISESDQRDLEGLRKICHNFLTKHPNYTEQKSCRSYLYCLSYYCKLFQNWHTTFPEKNAPLMMHFYWHTLYIYYVSKLPRVCFMMRVWFSEIRLLIFFPVFFLTQKLMQPSMANLNSPSSRVVKDSTPFRRRILRCKHFGKGESWPSLFLDVVNLDLIKFRHRWILNERTFYSFIILFIWKWILT